MSAGVHGCIGGDPAPAPELRRFLDHVLAYGRIWTCGLEAIAWHWFAACLLAGAAPAGSPPLTQITDRALIDATSSTAFDNSAAFLGAAAASPLIARIEYFSSLPHLAIGLNQLSLVHNVPLPAPVLLLLVGLASMALQGERFRTRGKREWRQLESPCTGHVTSASRPERSAMLR